MRSLLKMGIHSKMHDESSLPTQNGLSHNKYCNQLGIGGTSVSGLKVGLRSG